jgi:hypothetical protein
MEPVHSRYDHYFICTDRKRTGWTLWLMANDFDTGKPMYAQVAYGAPFHGYDAQVCGRRADACRLER